MKSSRMGKFIITGTGRSGTSYIATLLNELGVSCGHEKVFHPNTLKNNIDFASYAGDASWLAAPFISQLTNQAHVLHQVRNPIAVARSFIGIGFFNEQPTADHLPYLRFLNGVAGFQHLDSIEERFMFHWVHWNRYVEEQSRSSGLAYQRYRLEDVMPTMIQRVILSPLGLQYGESLIREAQDKIGTKTNRRTRNLTISNQKLKQYPMYAQFESLANEYGYDLDKPS